jgi:hypothetical protein
MLLVTNTSAELSSKMDATSTGVTRTCGHESVTLVFLFRVGSALVHAYESSHRGLIIYRSARADGYGMRN